MHLEGIVAKRKRCSIVGTLFNDNLKLAIEREDGCWVAPLYGLGLFGVREDGELTIGYAELAFDNWLLGEKVKM